jgi:hypothetical protein
MTDKANEAAQIQKLANWAIIIRYQFPLFAGSLGDLKKMIG